MPAKKSTQNPTLETYLVALQKSISRTNRDTAAVKKDPNKISAIIYGTLDFQFSCKCKLVEDAKLEICEQDGVELTLSGKIDCDVGAISKE